MSKQIDGTDEATLKEFNMVVNMTPGALEKHLGTEESQSVGWTHEGEGEAVGHQSGRRIVEIKGKKKANLTDDDYAHMRKVIGYVHRHLAQGGPKDDKEHSRWRYSLMNWGHDPTPG
jgi:predicted ATP-dependent protease